VRAGHLQKLTACRRTQGQGGGRIAKKKNEGRDDEFAREEDELLPMKDEK